MPKTKILIVEDEPASSQLMRTDAAAFRLRANRCINGIEGLQVYNEKHQEKCLVLFDVRMPPIAELRWCIAFETHAHPNVIMMSGRYLSDLVFEEVKKIFAK